MKKMTHPRYRDYPEQPYISFDRDMQAWEETPELFPYGIVEKKQMQRLAEGILPGHIIMMWRISFGNFTNETMIPQYFEYRYGVDSNECIATLMQLGYVKRCNASDSLHLQSIPVLKRILVKNGLKTSGKKNDLLNRTMTSLSPNILDKQSPLRQYLLTPSGQEILKKYDGIIQKHGPKL